MKKLRLFAFAFIMVIATLACGKGASTAVSAPPPAQPVAVQPTSSTLLAGEAQQGETLAATLERLCDCQVGEYVNFGYLWVSEQRQFAVFFEDKSAFIWGRAVIPLDDLWVGDQVFIGTRSEIAELAKNYANVTTISSDSQIIDHPTRSGDVFKRFIVSSDSGRWCLDSAWDLNTNWYSC